MKIMALILFASILSAQTKQCAKGEYLTVDGRCLHDQTGESHPAGDGCNVTTCMDPACRMASTTAMYCSHPDDPAPIQPVTPVTGLAGTITAGDGMLATNANVVSVPSVDPAIQAVLDKHKSLLRKIRSCHKRHWPVGDPVCEGAALSLAGWFVDEHPEYFEVKK